jgi:hypothetical protein
MAALQADELEARVMEAVGELRSIIAQHEPSAEFEVTEGDDPDGTYLIAYVDTPDVLPIVDLVIDRLLEYQIDEGLPVYVVPVHIPALRN